MICDEGRLEGEGEGRELRRRKVGAPEEVVNCWRGGFMCVRGMCDKMSMEDQVE